ncbi:hypothetical protein niasHS_006585 [Heterodera schachtii]|uniref:Uncharacterized protein n=1 Tax=Heterodera schachtii TaxID=97005 RepID=A0ABD2JHN6_HETSC
MAFRCRRRGKLCVFVRIGAVFVSIFTATRRRCIWGETEDSTWLVKGIWCWADGGLSDWGGEGGTIAQWIRWGPSGLRKEGMTTPSQHSGGPGAVGRGGGEGGGHVFEPSKRTTEKGKGEENTVDEKGEERGEEQQNTMQKTRYQPREGKNATEVPRAIDRIFEPRGELIVQCPRPR